MGLSCGFLVFDGFSNMVLASAIEPLRAGARLCRRRELRLAVAVAVRWRCRQRRAFICVATAA